MQRIEFVVDGAQRLNLQVLSAIWIQHIELLPSVIRLHFDFEVQVLRITRILAKDINAVSVVQN